MDFRLDAVVFPVIDAISGKHEAGSIREPRYRAAMVVIARRNLPRRSSIGGDDKDVAESVGKVTATVGLVAQASQNGRRLRPLGALGRGGKVDFVRWWILPDQHVERDLGSVRRPAKIGR